MKGSGHMIAKARISQTKTLPTGHNKNTRNLSYKYP